MTDRRRQSLILALVALMVVAAAVVLITKPTKKGLDLQGGVQLVYQLTPTKGSSLNDDSIQRTIDVMQDRINAFGVGESEIQRSGNDQIVVSLPAVSNTQEAERRVGTTAQLRFYDWEANIVGAGGAIDPTNPQITGANVGGIGAGGAETNNAAALTQYGAVLRASKFQRQTNPKGTFPTTTGDQWYLVNDQLKTVFNAVPAATVKDLVADIRSNPKTRGLVDAQNQPVGKRRFIKVPEGYRVIQAANNVNGDGKVLPAGNRWFIIRDRPALRGQDIKNPSQGVDTGLGGGNKPNVTFDFTSTGKKRWKDVTKEIAKRGSENCVPPAGVTGKTATGQYCNQHFTIVLDQQAISSPVIDFQDNPDGIGGNTGSQISGSFTYDQAKSLANLLKSGSLPLNLKVISSQQVSATLGQEALDQALVAGLVGFGVVAIFLIAFYRVLGLIAVAGLAVYSVFFLAIIKLVPVVLTLPGIAGLILTIAVAADANVVIFERVKDELQDGRSVPRAIKDGYRKGLSAIIDGNVITFLVAFVLFLVAVAGPKGFAFTLGIGVLLSMITAVLLTQAILGILGRSKLMSNPKALGARSRKPIWHRFDFNGAGRWFFAMSGVVLAIGAIAVGSRGLNFGIDFESGTQITATVPAGKTFNEDQVRDALKPVGQQDAKVQEIDGGKKFQVQTEDLTPAQQQAALDAIQKGLQIQQKDVSTNSVGPTFGETVARTAVIAIIASFVLIAFVIWFRFGLRYTVPILIAVVHDLLITAGIYALTGAEVTASTVAALLTIIGYSLYDTIIVFDRVRENLARLPSAAFSQIVNRSMSEVLGRSLVTSFSTGLPTLALLLFGGETLQDFALAMLIGTISGAYSSVFIAAPVLTEWMERVPAFKARRARLEAANDGKLPPYPEKGSAKEIDLDAAKKRRAERVTAPDEAGQPVSSAEFNRMVADLGIDDAPAGAKAEPEGPPPPVQRAKDLSPEEVTFRDDPARRAKPNRGKKKR
ncbi:protein translocase subunit SecDF [Patulibacter minatonensis]|uniref:protein translocase subunit SecDF n=1 Tax=Patulibacter minatonensis TaxID=298163 RepID=UPI00047C1A16|nr:protein translocase subunit SecDF [Patulibacter minatonensis]